MKNCWDGFIAYRWRRRREAETDIALKRHGASRTVCPVYATTWIPITKQLALHRFKRSPSAKAMQLQTRLHQDQPGSLGCHSAASSESCTVACGLPLSEQALSASAHGLCRRLFLLRSVFAFRFSGLLDDRRQFFAFRDELH